jgi:hypothetical protein
MRLGLISESRMLSKQINQVLERFQDNIPMLNPKNLTRFPHCWEPGRLKATTQSKETEEVRKQRQLYWKRIEG